MKLCLVSHLIGCDKCPVVKVCPGKTIIGDYEDESDNKSQRKEQGTVQTERRKN